MSEENRQGNAKGAPRLCPICRRAADAAFRPFCSRRCADVDLTHWFGEVYRVPATEAEPDDDDETPDRDLSHDSD